MSVCSIPDCGGSVYGRGYCMKHWNRDYRWGSPYIVKKRPDGNGSITKGGYRTIRGRLEHRSVMEAHLGRRLLSSEHVHHKDGDKLNNAIENLVLVTASSHRQEHRKYKASLTHKECARCREYLHRTAFYPSSQGANHDPHTLACKACSNKARNAYNTPVHCQIQNIKRCVKRNAVMKAIRGYL